MDNIVQIGEQKVYKNGGSLVTRAPEEWLAEYELEIGSPVFTVLTLDGFIRVHLTKVAWAKRSQVRRINRTGYLTLNPNYCRKLGIKANDNVRLEVDMDIAVLKIRRSDS
jgi:antitoxin component of MazEF toxin-antitoxin module